MVILLLKLIIVCQTLASDAFDNDFKNIRFCQSCKIGSNFSSSFSFALNKRLEKQRTSYKNIGYVKTYPEGFRSMHQFYTVYVYGNVGSKHLVLS